MTAPQIHRHDNEWWDSDSLHVPTNPDAAASMSPDKCTYIKDIRQHDIQSTCSRTVIQEAQMSLRACVMINVIENSATPLKLIWNYTIQYGMCKFLSVFYANYVSMLTHFWDIPH